MSRPLITAAVAALLAALPGSAPAASAVKVDRKVVYGTGQVGAPTPGRAKLLLDLYRPAKTPARPMPVVIVIHGGGFKLQSRLDRGVVAVSRALARQGIAAASIDYRLVRQEPVPSARVEPLRVALGEGTLFATMAAAAEDTLVAADYLKRNGRRLGIDAGRLGVVGSSAGAITADAVAYALDDYGIAAPEIRFAGSLWGGIYVRPPTGGAVGAPLLEAGEPALFAVHGDADPTVAVRFNDELVARAREQGVRSEYHRIAGGGHGFNGSKFFTAQVVGSQTPADRLIAFARSALR